MRQTLRRVGDSLVMTVPKAFVKQNRLHEGTQVELRLEGTSMAVIAPRMRRYKLEDLLAEMPDELPLVEGWDDMPPVGKETT